MQEKLIFTLIGISILEVFFDLFEFKPSEKCVQPPNNDSVPQTNEPMVSDAQNGKQAAS